MSTLNKIAVAGATGRVGRHVVEVLKARAHEVVAMSRSSGVNLVTGEGLATALSGVTCIIDAATGASSDERESASFFTASARNLQVAGERSGVRQIVVVSIVGCDRFPSGYNAAKRTHEKALFSGPVPVRVLRSTPFHEFVPQVMDWDRRDDVCYLPDMRTQLVAARTVAEALVDLAISSNSVPIGRGQPISEIAGPRAVNLVDKARLFAARRGDPVRVEIDLNDPDRDLNINGALLPGPGANLVGPTFEEWLEALLATTAP